MIDNRYNATPTYDVVGPVRSGWEALAADVSARDRVLAIDGPAALPWHDVVAFVAEALVKRGLATTHTDIRGFYRPWTEIERMTATEALQDDPDFERLATADLRDFFGELPVLHRDRDVINIVFGPGAALVDHDTLWYMDQPKRLAEATMSDGSGVNLGQPDDMAGSSRSLFYIDWPILDRHRDRLTGSIDTWVDCQNPAGPSFVAFADLVEGLAQLAHRPFRTRSYFNSTPWGGHWAQRQLGINPDARNTAVGYELIAPESGILLGQQATHVEVPLQMMAALTPDALLGSHVTPLFGTSFPIRFDYLDTVDGGPLSIHCHPQGEYMRKVFGWSYTQHETYYIMVGDESNTIFLGLSEESDPGRFRADVETAKRTGGSLDVARHVQAHPATEHQLFVIPAGTPHASGKGNVVLEISATPYLYSLRFYDWQRGADTPSGRPIHISHAFDNLDVLRSGDDVRAVLVPKPRLIGSGEGWLEYSLGTHTDLFYEVYRVHIEGEASAPATTDGRFHVINVVAGSDVVVTTGEGHHHRLTYAETMVIPAAVMDYTITASRDSMVVKALVR
ncbi:MAG: class I mannose-6-phosphate isomerase [Acidimicrobiia bacterium]|nr:MAG: class I mannose-6-phosphate isomerase [Acidimicrobiia bacterium]